MYYMQYIYKLLISTLIFSIIIMYLCSTLPMLIHRGSSSLSLQLCKKYKDSCQLFWKSSALALFQLEKGYIRALFMRADRSLHKSWFSDRPELPLKTQHSSFNFVCEGCQIYELL